MTTISDKDRDDINAESLLTRLDNLKENTP